MIQERIFTHRKLIYPDNYQSIDQLFTLGAEPLFVFLTEEYKKKDSAFIILTLFSGSACG